MVILVKLLNLHPRFNFSVMAVTRLKRKDRRNKARAANRVKRIKQLSRKPVIRNLEQTDVEASTLKAAEPVAEEVAASEEEE